MRFFLPGSRRAVMLVPHYAPPMHQTARDYAAAALAAGLMACAGLLAGCKSAAGYRHEADKAGYEIVRDAQRQALGRAGAFTVEPASDTLRRRLLLDHALPYSDPASLGSPDVKRIPQWPDAGYGLASPTNPAPFASGQPLHPTLLEALQIAARNSREYQQQKETVFAAALKLDLERDAFRRTWTGVLDAMFSTDGSGDEQVTGVTATPAIGLEKKLKTGGSFAMDLGVDLVKLLTQDKASALGVLADATLSIPLLRGSGRFVVTEPLTQAERDVVYAIHAFERFRQSFAVRVAQEYLGVVQAVDQVDNARENYLRLMVSTRRAVRLAEAGRLPEIQVDQVRQDELRARNRWISAQLGYEGQLDRFKVLLGLPTDAPAELDRQELARLSQRAEVLTAPAREAARSMPAVDGEAPALPDLNRTKGGPLEIDAERAVRLALDRRLDLRTQVGRVFDAQRAVAVSADLLRADLLLLGRGTAGEARALGTAGEGDASLDLDKGRFAASMRLDLPWERTRERNLYRSSLLAFESAVRDVQALEDQIKLDVRDELRTLLENRETVAIQAMSYEVAKRRRESTAMFLEAGRAEVRDVLEAEEALVSAQNALSAALVNYRVAELQLQSDMGVLEMDEDGLWTEWVPGAAPPGGGAPRAQDP
jgi:outer membrane protein TolC